MHAILGTNSIIFTMNNGTMVTHYSSNILGKVTELL